MSWNPSLALLCFFPALQLLLVEQEQGRRSRANRRYDRSEAADRTPHSARRAVTHRCFVPVPRAHEERGESHFCARGRAMVLVIAIA